MVTRPYRPLIVTGAIVAVNSLIIGSFVRAGYSRCEARMLGFGNCGTYSAGAWVCNVGAAIGVVLLLVGIVLWAARRPE